MRRAALALSLLVACKSSSHESAKDAAPQRGDCAAAFAAPAPAGAFDHGTAALLAGCTPCGMSWQPLITTSAFDIEAPPDVLPPPPAIFAVLDACQHTCSSTARSDIADELRTDEVQRAPSTPWRDIATRCSGALALDDHTRRFARGTWYALAEVARAVPTAVRELPLPPFTAASTAFALPRTDALAPWAPRVHVTVADTQVFVGVLPWVRIADGALSLVPGPGLDYPGDPADVDHLADALAKVDAALAGSTHPADADTRVVMVAPRAMPLARALAVAVHLPGPAWLAGTPRTPGNSAWPEPIAPIACAFAVAHAGAAGPVLDLGKASTTPAPERIATAPLPAGTTTVQLILPASAQIDDLAAALSALSTRAVTTAVVSLSP